MIALRSAPPAMLLAGGWLCLSGTAVISAWLPPMFAASVGLGAGMTWLLREVRGERTSRRGRRSQSILTAASVSFLAYPLWIAGLAWGFRSANWTCPEIEPVRLTAIGALCVWFLAPVFEECLYRGRLFDAWSTRTNETAAVAGTSLLFAIPHLEPCGVVASFVVGCLLGAIKRTWRNLSLCVGVHCGFNLGASFWPRVGSYVAG